MVVEIFNNNIAVPAKCGTRYFSKCVKSPERTSGYMNRIVSCLPSQSDITFTKSEEDSPILDYNLWKSVEWLVVRDSYEWLKSALHTEIVTCWNDREKMSNIIEEFISPGGNTHWCGLFFQKIHFLYRNHNIKRFKILQIDEITNFLFNMGYDIKYNKDEYSFLDTQNWKSKDEIVYLVQNEFPKEWEEMLNLIKKDKEYYEYVVNNKTKFI